eukprot:RCo044800
MSLLTALSPSLLLLLLALLHPFGHGGGAHAQDTILPTVVLTVSSATGHTHETVYAALPMAPDVPVSRGLGPALPPEGIALALTLPEPANGCKQFKTGMRPGSFAVVLKRGACSFSEKIVNAQRSGAAAVIIAENVLSLYSWDGLPTTPPMLKESEGGACTVNCDLGSSNVPGSFSSAEMERGYDHSSCAQNSRCASKICALTGQNSTEEGQPPMYRVCCLPDRYLRMMLDPNSTAFLTPSVFISASDGLRVMAALKASRPGAMTVRMAPLLDSPALGLVSPMIIWALGVAVVVGGTYYSAGGERRLRERGSSVAPSPESSVQLTTAAAQCYLVFAVVTLVGMYFLVKLYPHLVVLVLIGVFCVAGATSAQIVVMEPVVSWALPRLATAKTTLLGLFQDSPVSWSSLVALVFSVSLGFAYFVGRHSSVAWVLQDALSVAVCCQFLSVLRLTRLHTAVVMLLGFMAYDVFMVFVTPFFFHESVMVKVATAGKGTATVSPTHPLECVRVPDERVPMLLMIPGMTSHGGYSILGLGDILLPGLLLSFVLRFETLRGHSCAPSGGCGPEGVG